MSRERLVGLIATVLLVLMSVQYIPLEGIGASYVKAGVMALTPLIWLFVTPVLSSVNIWATCYFASMLFAGMFRPDTFDIYTLIYQLLFLILFCTYYNLVYIEGAFSRESFTRLIKRLMAAYIICLVTQQLFRIFGFSTFSLINLFGASDRGLLVVNSLALEQSHSARILTVLFLALIRMYEVKSDSDEGVIRAIYRDNRWLFIGFMWAMLTMGSGTAYVGLAILALYVVKPQYAMWSIPLLVIIYFLIPYIDIVPLQRVRVTFEAVLTLDRGAVMVADHSASARVIPLINTINNLDLTDLTTWFGHGIDSNVSGDYRANKMIGGIWEYGLLSYIFSLVLVLRYCIKLWSLELIIFILMLSAGIGNIAYTWAIMMIFTTVRYLEIGDCEENT